MELIFGLNLRFIARWLIVFVWPMERQFDANGHVCL